MQGSKSKKRERSRDDRHWCAIVAAQVESVLGLIPTSNRSKNTVSTAVQTGTRVNHEFFEALPRNSGVLVYSLTMQFALMNKIRRIDTRINLDVKVPAVFEEHKEVISERLRWSAARATLRELKPYKLVTQKVFRKLLLIANLEFGTLFNPSTTDFDYWLERGREGWMLVSTVEL